MNDLAVPVNSVDALHAHFAEWIRFLDAKGLELEAQLAKLEARKNRLAAPPDSTPTSPEAGYLELAFGPQALASTPGEGPKTADESSSSQVDHEPPEDGDRTNGGEQDACENRAAEQIENLASSEALESANPQAWNSADDSYMV